MARVKKGRRLGGVYKVGQWFYARWTVSGIKKTVPTHCTNREDAEKVLDKLTHIDLYDNDLQRLQHIQTEIAARVHNEDVYQREHNKVEWDQLVERVLTVKGFPLDINSNRSKGYYHNIGFFTAWMKEHHQHLTHVATVTDEIAREFSTWIKQERGDCVHNATIKILRATWHALENDLRLEANPWKRIPYVQYNSVPTETLTDEDAGKIELACKSRMEYEVMWVLSKRYAMRLSDACLRKWSDISPDGATLSYIPWKIRRHGEKARITVPMCEEVRNVLERVPKTDSPYILPAIATDYLSNSGGVEKRILRLIERSGINRETNGRKKKGWHSIRVWAISKMLQHAPMATVQSIAGHLQASQTQHYYRGDMDKTRKAIESMHTPEAVAAKPRHASSADISKVMRGESVIISKAEHERLLDIERRYSALLQAQVK